jgi:hypothetical protein
MLSVSPGVLPARVMYCAAFSRLDIITRLMDPQYMRIIGESRALTGHEAVAAYNAVADNGNGRHEARD